MSTFSAARPVATTAIRKPHQRSRSSTGFGEGGGAVAGRRASGLRGAACGRRRRRRQAAARTAVERRWRELRGLGCLCGACLRSLGREALSLLADRDARRADVAAGRTGGVLLVFLHARSVTVAPARRSPAPRRGDLLPGSYPSNGGFFAEITCTGGAAVPANGLYPGHVLGPERHPGDGGGSDEECEARIAAHRRACRARRCIVRWLRSRPVSSASATSSPPSTSGSADESAFRVHRRAPLVAGTG